MTTRNLENITIHQFRGLKELELKDLGQINLLVGVNNSGKTSVLEALSIYCNSLDLRNWIVTATARENLFTTSQTPILISLRWLFDKKIHQIGTIFISGDGQFAVKDIKVTYEEIEGMFSQKKLTRLNNLEKLAGLIGSEYKLDNEEDVLQLRKGLNLKIELNNNQSQLLDSKSSHCIKTYQIWEHDFLLSSDEIKHEYILITSTITPTSHRSNIGQIKLLSEASFRNFKDDVLDLLSQMDANISDIEILADPESTDFYAGIYIQHKKLGLIPLSSFGDGVRRLLHIALKLARVKGGILLIDELESTIHTEALQNSFQWLAKWSKEMNVQIFATTHSLEAVDALLAVNKSASDLVLYRLEPKETQTKVVRHDWSRLKRLREELGQEVRW
jgi:predicted ATP-dependent endonuclease of OLD family